MILKLPHYTFLYLKIQFKKYNGLDIKAKMIRFSALFKTLRTKFKHKSLKIPQQIRAYYRQRGQFWYISKAEKTEAIKPRHSKKTRSFNE